MTDELGHPEYAETLEQFLCCDCGYLGPAYMEAEREIQGVPPYTAVAWVAVGEPFCASCGSYNLE